MDSPADIWKTAKEFMDWEDSGGPPSQLSVNNMLITKASLIAIAMNQFFIEKVQTIRNGIQYLSNFFLKCKDIIWNMTCKLGLKQVSIAKVNKLLKSKKKKTAEVQV